jgi:S-DNA-T family DNA segregation ATPase FtsK/SpoIIIE
VAQKVDSRTILDEQGAELLLGKGDMLVKLNGSTDTLRVQCPFVSEEEVAQLTEFLRSQGAPEYCEAIVQEPDAEEGEGEGAEKLDARFDEALAIVRDTQRCSTSWLQRKMTIGYNRAAKIVEMMEKRGYVGAPNGARDREILLPPG